MPKNTTLSLVFFIHLTALLLVISSCQQERRAKKMPESVAAYVYGYTSGVISRDAEIRIRFASATAEEDQIGQEADGKILSFAPAISGKAYWEDIQTLRFEPEEELESGQVYVATVHLSRVFDGLPSDAKSFEFDFRTRDQFVQLDLDGIHTPTVSDLSRQEVHGTIYTSDAAESDELEAVLEARQSGKQLPVEWVHSADRRQHKFEVREVERGAKASFVSLSWSGKPLNTQQKGEMKVEVPALGDFKILSASVVQGQDQYIKLHFSDPLDENQDLEGMVTLANQKTGFRYLVDGNKLKLYPTSRQSGSQMIRVSPGIRNAAGQKMKNASQWEVVVEEAQPQVRLVGSGVIMPESDGLIFPFEAVSLTAVEVEIFKIYHNNILQFLQTNKLDGQYDLHQVGRVVRQVKVPLQNLNPNASASEWTRYALDLSGLIAEDAKAIYQIRIGFRKEYATYFCGAQDVDNEVQPIEASFEIEEESEEFDSFMDNWYGFDGYYSGYSYQHRNNPCFSAYYNADRFISRNVVASNLGLIAKGGDNNEFFVTVADIRNARPVAGATLEFYDFQQQLLHTAETDDKGMATARLARKPFVVLAKRAEERGYLRLQDGDALSYSRFDVSGAVSQKGLKGFLYGDRGVWRPGDSVFLNFILEDEDGKLPPNYPVSFELKNPRGQTQMTRVEARNVRNVYPLHFATQPDDPTGIWRATVKAGGATFTKSLRIETVKPNRIKIDVNFGKEKLSVADEPLQAELAATWLHGAPAGNLKAKVEAQLTAVNTTFSGFNSYEFDDPARKFSSEPATVFDGTLNSQGKEKLSFYLSNKQQMPGRLNANFKSRVFERGGDFSTNNLTLPYDPYTTYAGVSLPTDQYEQKRLEVDKTSPLRFVSVNTEGKASANRKLSVGIYRVEWRWWWDRGEDYVTRYNSSSHYEAMDKQVLTTNSKGEAQWDYTVNEWGRYLVRVCDTESGHCSGDFFYAGYPWYGEEGNDQYRQAAAMVTFTTDKEKYNVGETVTVRLPEGKSGQALITVENGEQVLQSFWADTKDGENTFTFEATEAMAPNIYAHVAILQPHAQVANDLPIRMYGVVPVMVEDPATRLAPKINVPKEIKPEQSFTVEVSEESGQAMAYTVAIVDEGLLGLTNHETPDPWNTFYAREALGVKTWDVYDQVLGAYGAELERLLSIGGDAAAIRQKGQDDRANRFKPVVMHLGPFELKKGKKAQHEFRMPNYVGAVRVMVVAANEGAYGKVDQTVPVRQPLMVLGTLPRVLSPGEQLQLPVNVFAMDKKVRNVSVFVEETSGLVSVANNRQPDLQFAQPGDQIMNFAIQVKERVGVAKFKITAKGNGESASQEIEIQVRNPNPYVTDVDAKQLDPSGQHDYRFTATGMPGTNEAILEVSSIPPINLGERLDYLIRYPYGCLEQTLSGGFPQLYVRQLLDLNEQQEKEVPANIQATIERLKHFQTSTGGFAYWPGNTNPNLWSSSYAGHFLLEAKALGYTVPASMMEKWIQYQKKAAKLWNPDREDYGYSIGNNTLMQAYRLFTLALAQKPDLGAMNRLREEPGLNAQGKWRLAAAYALAGKPEVAKKMVQNASYDVEAYRSLGYTYGSRLRDRAMFLEAMVLMDDRDNAAPIVQYISDEMSSRRWLSTQETAFALLAIGKYVGNNNAKAKLAFSYQIDNGKTVNAGSDNPVFQLKVPVNAGKAHSVLVRNNSNGPLFTRMIRTGQPIAGTETAASSYLSIRVRYLDTEGNSMDPSAIPQGTDFVAEVKVTHDGTRPMSYQEMALSQVFPSGWEIINTRMDNLQGAAFKNSSRPEYQDIRDDRVNTFFDLGINQTDTYQIQLNAAYQGRFYLPAVNCSAMYDNSIHARQPGKWVEVTTPRGI
jgi:hypothetical protein